MRLSEAIRLGAMLKPQGGDEMLRDGRTCALGAAADAIGRLRDWWDLGSYDAWRSEWPLLTKLVVSPISGQHKALLDAITCLNDSGGWTREQIADWVETIEQAQPQPATEAGAVCPVVEPQMAVVRA